MALVSPPQSRLDGLPTELIAEFIYTSHREGLDNYANVIDMSHLKTLQSLSSVSSRWRAIVQTTPRLWGCISIGHKLLELPPDIAIPILQAQLDRSRDVSLDLVINLGFSDAKSFLPLWPYILPHVHRLRTLSITGLTMEIAQEILPLGGNMGRLESVKLLMTHVGPSPILQLFSFPETARCLTNILCKGAIPASLPSNRIKQLHLNTNRASLPHLLSFLQTCSHVERAALDVRLEAPDAPLSNPSFQRIELPALKVLSITGWRFDRYLYTPSLEKMLWRQMPSGFDPIELPSLRHLTIISPDPSSFAQWSSSYSLRTLELVNADGTLKLFSSLLPTQSPYGDVPVRPFPALRRLDIRWNGVESRASADPAKLPDAIGRVLSDRPALTIGYGDPLPVADRLKWPRFDNDDLASRWVQLSEPADKAEWAWIYGYDP